MNIRAEYHLARRLYDDLRESARTIPYVDESYAPLQIRDIVKTLDALVGAAARWRDELANRILDEAAEEGERWLAALDKAEG